MGISQYRLAKEIGVPQRRIGEIVAGTRAVTVDTGLRLSRFFGTSEGFWTGLQLDYDAATAKNALAKELAQIKPWATAACRSCDCARRLAHWSREYQRADDRQGGLVPPP